jgi:hypothetical protein
MIETEQQIALAKWSGIEPCPIHKGYTCDVTTREGCGYCPNLPDYVHDLNAVHEIEKKLNIKQQVWYLQKLTQVRFKEGVSGMICCMIDKTAFATAAQRCEALLKILGLWKEDV